MLVLSRRVGERIFFPGICAYVKVLAVKGGTVRLSIEAPPEVRILREELRVRRRLGATGRFRLFQCVQRLTSTNFFERRTR